MTLIEQYGALTVAGKQEEAASALSSIAGRLEDHEMEQFNDFWADVPTMLLEKAGGALGPQSARTMAELAWMRGRNLLTLGADWKPPTLQEIFDAKRADRAERS